MIYVTFQGDVHFNTETPPSDSSCLWVTTIPVGEVDAKNNSVFATNTQQFFMKGDGLSFPVYKFESLPILKRWSTVENNWKKIPIKLAGCKLITRDDFILQDINRIYLTAKKE